MTQRTTRIPTPVYAVAGVGEIAYRQLRELREEFPQRVAGLRSEIAGLRTEIPARVEQFRADVPATVNSFVTGAYEVYGTLVRRGEKVVGRRRTVTVSTHTAPATTAKSAPKAAKKTATKTVTTRSTTRTATKAPAKRAASATKATKRATAK